MIQRRPLGLGEVVVGVVALWLFSRGVSWVVGRSEAAKVVKAIMECKTFPQPGKACKSLLV